MRPWGQAVALRDRRFGHAGRADLDLADERALTEVVAAVLLDDDVAVLRVRRGDPLEAVDVLCGVRQSSVQSFAQSDAQSNTQSGAQSPVHCKARSVWWRRRVIADRTD